MKKLTLLALVVLLATLVLAGSVQAQDEMYVNHLFASVADFEAATGETIESFNESPMLAEMVASGDLPPVEERLPVDIGVLVPREEVGVYSGPMNLMGFYEGAEAFSQFTENSEQGLMMYDPGYSKLYPNIAKDWSLSDDAMSLTIMLREGMKWSDGEDFNADDFVFWYEEITKDPEITANIESRWMPGDELMGLNKIDDLTVEFTFSVPYFRSVEVFAGQIPAAPEHFIKQYMPTYNPDAEALAASEDFESWQQAVRYHAAVPGTGGYNVNVLAPTLNPWVIKDLAADSVLWERNPYYWRVDSAGNQLPYLDSILLIMTDSPDVTAPVMTLAGELDFSNYGLSLSDFPVFKRAEEESNFGVYLWPRADQSHAMGVALNYTHQDPVLREIFNDLRFRQALSLAINREEISENLFLGLTEPYTAPVSPVWTGYEDWMGTYFAEFDIEQANALLDEMGLEWDDNEEFRLRPDGERLTLNGEWATEWLSYSEDMFDLIKIHWAEIGVDFQPRFLNEEPLQTRFAANETDMGLSNSDGGSELTARGDYPMRLLPPWHWAFDDCCPMSSLPWRWWLNTNGEHPEGIEPPDDIKRAWDLSQQWLQTPFGTEEYEQLINEVIKINVEGLYYFGTVSSPPAVFSVGNRVGNAPREDGVFGSWVLTPYLGESWYITEG